MAASGITELHTAPLRGDRMLSARSIRRRFAIDDEVGPSFATQR